MAKRALIAFLVAMLHVCGMAQIVSDSATMVIKSPDVHPYSSKSLSKPEFSTISPNIVTPTLNNYIPPEPVKLNYKFSDLPDSIKAMPEISTNYVPIHLENTYNFHGNPYSSDWSASGEILKLAPNLSLVGSGSRTSYPALGNMATGSVGLSATFDERLTFGLGLSGVKYHMGRSAWNDYGFYGNASYQLTDRWSLNAFGQYYLEPRYHSMASMGYMQNAVFGGTVGYKFSDSFRLDVGAQRYYDPYSHTWKTLPIVQPTFKLFGSPISVDVGGFIYQLVESIIESSRKSNYAVPASTSVSTGPAPVRFPSARAQGATITHH